MASVGSTLSTSSSTSSSSTTVYNGHYYGLASGLDVDSLVKALVSDKQEQIDKANQQKQTLEWQQQAYQSIISSLDTFMSTYLSTGGSSSMLLSSVYNTYTPSVSGSSAITATVTSAIDGSITHHIDVTQSAVAGSVTGNELNTAITGTLVQSAGGTVGDNLAGTSMNVTVDGLQKTITFTQAEVAANDSSYSSMASLIQNKINSAFGYPPDSSDPTNIKVSVTADSTGKLTIASSSRYQSAISVSGSGSVTGTAKMTADTIKGTSFNMTVTGSDGTAQTKTISFGAGDTVTDLQSYIQGKIDDAFGSNVLSVTVNSLGQVGFRSDGTAAPSFSFAKDPSATGDGLAAMGISDGTSVADSLTALGITGAGGKVDSASNRLSLSTSLSSLFGGAVIGGGSDGKTFTVAVNGKDITLSTDDTLSQAFNTINTSGAGVTVSYSSLTNTVSMKSNTTGASTTVTYDDKGSNFFSTLLNGTPPDSNIVQGKDAVFTLDGTQLSRSTNSFTIDGVTYAINQAVTSEQKADISFTQNISGAVTGITNFVNAYNTLLGSIETQLATKPDSNYPPLTDSQKSSMSDSDIEKWNEKAQSGLLFGDDALTNIVDTMRNMLYQPVTTSDGSTITLYQIGITTTGDITKGGQLQIDTAKLTQALQNNSAAVGDLFTKQSSTYYHLDMDGQSQRKTEEGVAYRLQDIINDATSTGVYPYVGSLIAIAGTSGDTSTSYSINRQLKAIDEQIDEYTQAMTDKKNALYSQFTTLETYMSQMNMQSSMISSFASGSGSG